MTKREALKLYCKTVESFGFSKNDYSLDLDFTASLQPTSARSSPAILPTTLQEMRAIVAAKSDRAAGEIIEWWGCWDDKFTPARWVKRARQIAAGTYKP